MFADYLGQQERRNSRHHESDGGQSQRVRERSAVAVLSAWKGSEEFRNAAAEIHRQAGDCAELNDNRIHLPIAIRKADMQERFRDAQMSGGTDGQELRQAFDDS